MLERFYEEAQDRSGLVEVLKLRLQNARNPGESVELLRRIARESEEGARDVVGATEHYQKILELQPENRDALEALGRIYESTEQWAEFVDVTRKQIKVTSDRNTKALLYFRWGSVMEAKFGREAEAIKYYDAAIKTSSSCLPAVHGLRDLYRRREEWPRVIETLEARGQAVGGRQGARGRVRADRPGLRGPARRRRARDALLRERARDRSGLPAGEPGAVRRVLRAVRVGAGAADRQPPRAAAPCATAIR